MSEHSNNNISEHSSSEITFTLLISMCQHRDHAAFLLISATLSRETPKTEAHAMYVMS